MGQVLETTRLQLDAWRLLAEATTEIAERPVDNEWLDEAKDTLLLLADKLAPDDIAREGWLTHAGELVASLDGWRVAPEKIGGSAAIQHDPDSDAFASDQDALAHVERRASSGEPGTRLHRVALSLIREVAHV